MANYQTAWYTGGAARHQDDGDAGNAKGMHRACGEAASIRIRWSLAGLGVNSPSMTAALDDVRAGPAEVTFEEASTRRLQLNGDFLRRPARDFSLSITGYSDLWLRYRGRRFRHCKCL